MSPHNRDRKDACETPHLIGLLSKYAVVSSCYNYFYGGKDGTYRPISGRNRYSKLTQLYGVLYIDAFRGER